MKKEKKINLLTAFVLIIFGIMMLVKSEFINYLYPIISIALFILAYLNIKDNYDKKIGYTCIAIGIINLMLFISKVIF